MPKKVTFDVTANTKGAQKGLSDVSKASGVMAGILAKLGPVGSGIASVLDKLGVKNLDAAAGFGIATAAIGASIKIGEEAIDKYVALGEEIQHYSAVTGESAEASSRQVEAFKELGVEADVAAAGMFKLGKAIATNPKALEDLGVQIAKNVDGTTNMNETLLNVIDAWQKQGDAAKRDQIILAAFGKSGAALVPILETNAAKLRQLEDTIAKVYTAKDLEAIRQYTIAQKQAKASADEWALTLGQALLPAQKSVYDSLNENVFVAKNYDAKLKELTGSSKDSYAAHVLVDRALRKEWQAAQGAAIATDELASAAADATKAAQDEADAEDKLYNAIHKNQDASFALRQAKLDLIKATKDATAAGGKDAEANLRQEEAIFAVADAAVAAKEQQAELANKTLTASDKAAIQIASLKELSKHLDKKSQTYKDIQAYIALLHQIPANITTAIGVLDNAAAAHKPAARASGGPVAPGTAYTVGEHGPETLVMGDQGGGIVPNGSGRGSGVTVIIQGGIFMDHGPSLDRLSLALAQRLRQTTGI